MPGAARRIPVFGTHRRSGFRGSHPLPQFVILGVRHFPHGEEAAILSYGAWRTPLGDFLVDAELAAGISPRVRCFVKIRLRINASTRSKCSSLSCKCYARALGLFRLHSARSISTNWCPSARRWPIFFRQGTGCSSSDHFRFQPLRRRRYNAQQGSSGDRENSAVRSAWPFRYLPQGKNLHVRPRTGSCHAHGVRTAWRSARRARQICDFSGRNRRRQRRRRLRRNPVSLARVSGAVPLKPVAQEYRVGRGLPLPAVLVFLSAKKRRPRD